jgi:hypothetical protein
MQFWLGPAGDLQPLPIVEHTETVQASAPATVAEQLSASGRRTRDHLGPPRGTWVIPWRYLTGAQLASLETIVGGHRGRPLWLLDSQRPNRAHRTIADAGTSVRSAAGWEPLDASSAGWLAITDPPLGVPLRGVVTWTRATTAQAHLATARTRSSQRTPLAGGEAVRLVSWARGTVAVAPGVDVWTTAGVLASTFGTAVTLHPTNWTQLGITHTPTGTDVTVAPVWRVAAGQAASTVQLTAVLVAPLSAAADWTPGGGAPQVHAALEHTYVSLDEIDVTLTAVEV